MLIINKNNLSVIYRNPRQSISQQSISNRIGCFGFSVEKSYRSLCLEQKTKKLPPQIISLRDV